MYWLAGGPLLGLQTMISCGKHKSTQTLESTTNACEPDLMMTKVCGLWLRVKAEEANIYWDFVGKIFSLFLALSLSPN